MKTTLIILATLIALASLSQAVVINATFTNSSATSFTCAINMNNTGGENLTTLIYIASNTNTTPLYYNDSIAHCVTNTSVNISKTLTIITTPCQELYCVGEAYRCDIENGSISYANKTVYGPNCTTTTTSTTLNQGITYSTLWGLHDAGNMNGSAGTGIGNTTGVSATILGLGKTNFFNLASLILITITIIGISQTSVKAGIIAGIVATDMLALVLIWLIVPLSLLFLVNLLAVLIFVGGNRK